MGVENNQWLPRAGGRGEANYKRAAPGNFGVMALSCIMFVMVDTYLSASVTTKRTVHEE